MTMLTPIAPAGKTADGHLKMRYRCACGNETEVAASRVRNGYTRSCGCLINLTPRTKHGMHGTPTYASWSSAKDRATNPSSKDYHRYGAVGIGMHPEWANSFEAFLRDVGERPDGTTIDRIDNRLGYVPGNVRWATPVSQQNNRRTTVFVRARGQLMALADAARLLGITTGALHMRLKRGKAQEVEYA